jgi:hypothetical protein
VRPSRFFVFLSATRAFFGIAGADMIQFSHIQTERTQGRAAFFAWFLGAKSLYAGTCGIFCLVFGRQEPLKVEKRAYLTA